MERLIKISANKKVYRNMLYFLLLVNKLIILPLKLKSLEIDLRTNTSINCTSNSANIVINKELFIFLVLRIYIYFCKLK